MLLLHAFITAVAQQTGPYIKKAELHLSKDGKYLKRIDKILNIFRKDFLF